MGAALYMPCVGQNPLTGDLSSVTDSESLPRLVMSQKKQHQSFPRGVDQWIRVRQLKLDFWIPVKCRSLSAASWTAWLFHCWGGQRQSSCLAVHAVQSKVPDRGRTPIPAPGTDLPVIQFPSQKNGRLSWCRLERSQGQSLDLFAVIRNFPGIPVSHGDEV